MSVPHVYKIEIFPLGVLTPEPISRNIEPSEVVSGTQWNVTLSCGGAPCGRLFMSFCGDGPRLEACLEHLPESFALLLDRVEARVGRAFGDPGRR